MKVPGGNLLKKALSVISSDSFTYLQFNSRRTDDTGIDVPEFMDGVTLSGSVQPVSRSAYQSLGLDWKKAYIQIYSSEVITGIDRGSSGDRVIFNDRTYQVLAENDWQPMDGWNGVLCVRID